VATDYWARSGGDSLIGLSFARAGALPVIRSDKFNCWPCSHGNHSLAVVPPRSVIGRDARGFGCGDATRIKELVFDLHRNSM
jgi:hypothetical protein